MSLPHRALTLAGAGYKGKLQITVAAEHLSVTSRSLTLFCCAVLLEESLKVLVMVHKEVHDQNQGPVARRLAGRHSQSVHPCGEDAIKSPKVFHSVAEWRTTLVGLARISLDELAWLTVL